MTTEITIAQVMDRLVAISKANVKNAETVLKLAELMRGHVAEVEREVEELRRKKVEKR